MEESIRKSNLYPTEQFCIDKIAEYAAWLPLSAGGDPLDGFDELKRFIGKPLIFINETFAEEAQRKKEELGSDPEYIKQERIKAIYSELNQLDFQTIRPSRAVENARLLGENVPEDEQKIKDIEKDAQGLRTELSGLTNPE